MEVAQPPSIALALSSDRPYGREVVGKSCWFKGSLLPPGMSASEPSYVEISLHDFGACRHGLMLSTPFQNLQEQKMWTRYGNK
ncbi:hypothetical protein CDAR_312971 [Caerostris darwini]|uniref:Uncharacterized protein n=1 Tax=Caerostris darwini TaxID=1538125 RepID=A0AAV4S1V6_9ARAC|nr:hypothetical protein CDAR_312971 [Caerostris darwini]